jgi:AraC-like DNA-binding protein/tetratricopeptide (TPR) repeat protein
MEELAAAAGVSSRTLQRQFRLFLGKAPRSELVDIRFATARRVLLRGVAGTKVVDVALRCGFSHFGRFAGEYRRRYGEPPSQTLKRQSLFKGNLAMGNSFVTVDRDRPAIALGPIEADRECGELARDVAHEMAIALMRAGISVTNQSTTALYHLTGIVRASPPRTRLSLRLVETHTGRHLWAYQADDAFGAEFGFDEQVATRICAVIQLQLRQAEIERACRTPDSRLTPTDLALRATPGVLSLDAAGNMQALELLDRAMDRAPDHALAAALAAWAHAQRIVYHFTASPLTEHIRSAQLARKALSLSSNATVLAILGTTFTLLHDIETADHVIRKALSVDGGSAWTWSRYGWIGVYSGDVDSAIERFKIALDLAPHDSLAFNSLVGIGCAHFNAGRYLEAARWQERALAAHPSALWIHRTLCPAYVLSGADGEAHSSLTALREHYPDLTISQVRKGLPPLPIPYRELVVETLSSLGLPG